MSVEGRELGWDDSIKQDSQNFDPIPEGDYNVTIEKYDRSRSKGCLLYTSPSPRDS